MPGFEEKRQYKRISDSFIVTYRFVSPQHAVNVGPGEYEGVALDVSESGIGIDVDNELPAGARLEVRFKILNEHSPTELHKRREFTLHSEVRHCRHVSKSSFRAGLLFKNISESDREFIQAYIRDQTFAQFGVRA